MGVVERKKLIQSIEAQLGARVLSVVTGDRQNMQTRIAPDLLPLVSEHLSRIGSAQKITLFLYTPGGDTIAAWGLVSLLRQYCERLSVMVSARALSAGTLIALGADEILMGRHGFLGPIDPSVTSPFNPVAQGSATAGAVQLLPVSVEDMSGFFALARQEADLKTEESMAEVLKILATHVHPLALGAVHRAREQSSSLARRLLSQHMDDEARVNRIVNKLTQELPTHSYLIGRREATEDIEIDLAEVSDELEGSMWRLYREYEDWLKLTRPVSEEQDLGSDPRARIRYERAAIESVVDDALLQHIYVSDKELFRITGTHPATGIPIDQVAERTVYQGWVRATNGETT